jgi:SAM-dependent methyltransferase
MSLRKYLILPKLISLTGRAPRDPREAWEAFWRGVRRTGPGGDVIWDVGTEAEREATLERMRGRLDTSLPILDVGAGNGRTTRFLATMFSRAIGVDVSKSAVERAREEARGVANVEFRELDTTDPGAGRALFVEHGEMNAFVRGVLHVLAPEARRVVIQNIRDVLGARGALYIVESDYEGDQLDLLVRQGATPTSLAEPLRLCIASGVRPPEHFSEREFEAYFPAAEWERLAAGPTFLHTLALSPRAAGERDELAAYYAIVRPRKV